MNDELLKKIRQEIVGWEKSLLAEVINYDKTLEHACKDFCNFGMGLLCITRAMQFDEEQLLFYIDESISNLQKKVKNYDEEKNNAKS